MIGIETVRKFLENDVEVFALVRPNSKNANRLPNSPKLRVIECDLKDTENLQINENGFDSFFHFGWRRVDRENPNDWNKQIDNINDTLKCVELADKTGCKTFIGAGTLVEYGRVYHKVKANEYVVPNTVYAAAKYSAGILSRVLCHAKKLRHIWARIFGVYGIFDDEKTVISYALSNMLNNLECNFTLCEQVWDYIYSVDCADAFYKIGLYGKNNAIYNIGTGRGKKLKDHIEKIKEITKSDSKLNFGAIPYEDIQPMYYVADIKQLTRDTGWIPKTKFEDGIQKILQFREANNSEKQ